MRTGAQHKASCLSKPHGTGLEPWSLCFLPAPGEVESPRKDGPHDLSKGVLSLLSLSSHHPLPSLNLSLEEEVASWLDLLGVLTSLDHTGV